MTSTEDDEFEYYEKMMGEPLAGHILRREAVRDILGQVLSSLLVLSVFWSSMVAVFLEELLVPLRLEELQSSDQAGQNPDAEPLQQKVR